jgi:hypothetical protein
MLAFVVPIAAAFALGAASPQFGQAPGGEIPILYDDHHVYSKPDVLRQNRVLAALVKDGEILVPLRSMFEQMGGAVSWNAATKSVSVAKAGATISVTLGKHVAIINGESRPLDVAPELYHGVLLVPVRVISEAMGAYVLWVANRRLVVVRYIPPTPIPTPPPTAPPTPVPPPPPTLTPTSPPTPGPRSYGWVQYGLTHATIYNEFANAQLDKLHGEHELLQSYVAGLAYVFKPSPWAIKFDYRQDDYFSTTQNVNGIQRTVFNTIDGGTVVIPERSFIEGNLDGRLEYRIFKPSVFVGVSYVQTFTGYGYPHLTGVGAGVEALQRLDTPFSWYAGAYYYPSVTGNYTVDQPASPNFGTTYRQEYSLVKYDAGVSWLIGKSPIYLFGGFAGDNYGAKQNAPIGKTHSGPYLGLGLKF